MTDNAAELLDKSFRLRLVSLSEIAPSVLRLIVSSMGVSQDVQITNGIPFRAVEIIDESVHFELLFAHYFLYMVINESHGAPETDAIWAGHKFRTYSKSRLLDNADAFGADYNMFDDGPLKHFEILTEDHLINVLTYLDPDIAVLSSAPTTTNIAGSNVWHWTGEKAK